MRKRIGNKLSIICDDVDLTKATNIEFYVRQGDLFSQYTPVVVSPSQMTVDIPFEDAMKLTDEDVKLQMAFTDGDGNPRASEIVTRPVRDLLKEDGYDAV